MSLVSLVVTLIIVGVLLWLVNYLPIDEKIKKIINVVVIVCVVLWLIGIFFGFSGISSIRIGR